MKLLSIFDYIYYCVYKILMKSPSRDAAHVSSVTFLTTMIGIHATFIYLIIADKMNLNIKYNKIVIMLIMFITAGILFYYYILKNNGKKIVKYYKDKAGDKHSVLIGNIVFIETFLFPFIVWGLIYIYRHWRK